MTVSPHRLTRVLLQHSGASHSVIALVDDARGLVIRAAGSARSLKADLDLPLTDPAAAAIAPVALMAYVAKTGQTAGAKELALASDPFIQESRPAAIFACPLRFESRIRGVLYFDSPSPSAFSAADQSIIVSLASQAVLALDRSRAAQELKAKIAEATAELSRQNLDLDAARRAAIEAKEAETRMVTSMSHELR